MPSLSETYRKNDTKPFGGYVAFNRLKEQMDFRYIEINEDPFDVAWKSMIEYSTNTKYSLYFLLTGNLVTSDSESDALYDYVLAGNDLFIAADFISENFLNKIGCETDRQKEIETEMSGSMKTTSVRINLIQKKSPEFPYYYYPFYNSFVNYDSSTVSVLGVNELGKPNFLVFFIGKGRLYLDAAPRAFSNYFLLEGNNHQYLQNVISFLRPDPKNIFWDEFYKKQDIRRKRNPGNSANQSNNFSSLSVINRYPSLKTAFWLAVVLLLLYVLFTIKRTQRAIDEKPPNVNSTVAFTETVGRLYLQKRNNKNIAEKMATYFYEHVRNKYFLNTTNMNDEFISSLSRKSGVPLELTSQLISSLRLAQDQLDISDEELHSLNQQIQQFLKNK